MQITSTCLTLVLATIPFGLFSVEAFGPPKASTQRACAAGSCTNHGPANMEFVNHQRKNGSFHFHLEAQAGEGEGEKDEEVKEKPTKNALDNVDAIAAEAEAAIKAANEALEIVKKTDDSKLIDADAIVAKDGDVADAIRKLAKGEIEAKEVTETLENKKNELEEEKRREQQQLEEEKRREQQQLEVERTKQEAERKKQESAAKKMKTKELSKDALVSAVGAAGFGAITGAALDVYLAFSDNLVVEVALPPLVLGATIGAAGFGLGLQDNDVGATVRKVFGGAVTSAAGSVSNSVNNAIQSTVDGVKAAPGKVQQAVAKKVDETNEGISKKFKETSDGIAAIPGKVNVAVSTAAEKTAGEIKAAPGKVKDAASAAAEKTASEIEAAASKAAKEIKATPGRVAQSTKEAVAKTVSEVEETIEKTVSDVEKKIEKTIDDTVALPKKALDEISSSVSKILPEANEKIPSVSQPKPPEIKLQTLQEVPTPPITIVKSPKSVPKPPKSVSKLPKMVSKLPKMVSKPPKMVPKPPEMPPPPSMLKDAKKKRSAPKSKKENDGFVFGEVGLKNLMGNIQKEKDTSISDDAQAKKAVAKENQEQKAIAMQKAKDEKEAQRREELERKEAQRQEALALKREQEARKREEAQRREAVNKEAQLAAAIKKKEAAEERQAALEQREIAAQERRATQAAAVEEKRKLAEERKAELAKIAEQKRAVASKSQAQSQLDKAKPGATISLGFLGFGLGQDQATPKPGSGAPKGLPTISTWRRNQDGSISGVISGSRAFPDGDSITTSIIIDGNPPDNSVVATVSGTRYYLEGKAGGGAGLFNLGSPKPAAVPKKKSPPKVTQQRAVDQRKAAEQRKRDLEEKRQAAVEAAAAKKRELEAKKQAQLQAREAQKRDLEAKKQAQLKAAEAKKKELEAKRQAQFESRKAAQTLASSKRGASISLGAQDQAKKAAEAVSQAKPGATISLGFFGFGQKDESPASAAPSGVPSLSQWVENSDGSITGLILGSKAFRSGESITTSRLSRKNPAAESLVTTVSGSRYFLGKKKGGIAGRTSAASAKNNELAAAQKARAEAAAAKKAQLASAQKARVEAAATKKADIAAAKKSQAQKADKVISEASPRSTISLGFLNFGGDTNSSGQPPKPASKAPPGVPTMSRWRQNRDGSISGVISGSKSYRAGESITTSPINGKAADGTIVQTDSGSKYYLAPKNLPAAAKAEEAISNAKSGATISLGFFNFGGKSNNEKDSTPGKEAAPKIVSKAPRGIPIVSKWRQNRNGSITGFVSGAAGYGEGESITTSPITIDAADGAIVTTTSGSRYYLEPKAAAKTGGGGLFGSGKTPAPAKKASVQKSDPAAARKAAAEKMKAEMEAAKQAREDAVAARKAELENAQKARAEAAATKKAELAAAQKARANAAAAKKSEMAAAAAAAKRQARAKKVEQVVSDASPRSTISLGFLNFGGNSDSSSKGGQAPKLTVKAPPGVPTMSRWRQNRDGSITGVISGSKSYRPGESVTTSPINGKAADGTVVQTSSGSKYYLAPKNAKAPAAKPATPAVRQTFSLRKPAAAPAKKAASKPLFSFGGGGASVGNKKDSKTPSGVPKLVNWRKNRDSSVTGFISGSPSFPEGDRITTSPITTGTIEAGQVVKTGSGSRYFLV